MGITSRKKILATSRKISYLRDASLIIIASEGRQTEKQYFESDCFSSSRLKIIVLESIDNKSAPSHVLHRIKEHINSQLKGGEKDLQRGDQFWLVVDKDNWTDKMLSNVCASAQQMKKGSFASYKSFIRDERYKGLPIILSMHQRKAA